MFRTLLILVILVTTDAVAEMPLVEKQVFEMQDFETFGGEVIPEVRVGWEAYGELNADRSNVILVTHHFSGTSHAAGRYSPEDPEPGYWDAIIGPGKAIDTDQFYVISSDTLVNANVHDEHVVTTGPASMALVTQQALHPAFFEARFPAQPNTTPEVLDSVTQGFDVTNWLWQRARQRARMMDANHVLYLVRASQTFVAGHDNDMARALASVQAESLFLPAAGDLLLRPELAREAFRELKAQGKPVSLHEIEGNMGHLDGLTAIHGQANRLARFLGTPGIHEAATR